MFTPEIGLHHTHLATAIVPPPLTISSLVSVGDVVALLRAEHELSNRSGGSSGGSSVAPHSCSVQSRQHCVLVFEGQQFVGIVTEHDLVQLIAAGDNLAEVAIASVMSSPLITLLASEFTDIFVPLSLLQRHSIDYLPLVDQQGKAVGLLTPESLQQLPYSFDLLHVSIAAEVMTDRIGYAASTTTLAELTQLMAAKQVSTVVLVDALNSSLRPIGLITARDIVQSFILTLDFATVQAQTVMHRVFAVKPDTSLWDVRQLMQKQQVHQVIVTSDAENLEGLVTQADLLSVLNPAALYQLTERLMRRNQAELAEHHRMEVALSASEKRYRQIAETTLEGIWMIDAENCTSYVNPRMAEMLGYTVDEMLGRSLFDFMDEAGQVQALRNLERRRQGIEEHHDFRFKTKTGQDVWVLIATNPLYDEVAGYVGSLAMLTDITDRKRAEAEKIQAEKLRLELNILEDMLDTILAGYWDWDLVNNTQYISPGFKRMFGYKDHELPNSPDTWKQLVFPEDQPKAAEAYRAHVESHGEVAYQAELRYRHKNGETLWIVCIGRVIKWDYEGNPVRLIGCHIDITDRKRTEAKLQQQADREHLTNVIAQRIRASLNLQEVLNTTVAEVHQVLHSDRVLVYRLLPDGQGEVVAESVSVGWQSLVGQVFPEEIFPKENYPRYVQGRIFALSDRKTDHVIDCLAEFLKTIQVRAKLIAPILQNETLWGLLVVHQCDRPHQWQTWEIDLLQYLSSQLSIAIQQSQLYAQLQESHQQLTHINAELLRATRLKDEFLANMSHELRTPLNVILGMSESLLDGVTGFLNERQEKSIATVERSGQHLLALINDILELSKIEAGKLELDISTVSIAQLCQSSLVFIRPQAFKKQIQLNVILPKNLGEIALDERRIRQVLINLLTNAVKFTPTAGRVTLEVHREPIEVNWAERVPITFSDSWPQSPLRSNIGCLDSSYYLCMSVMDTGIGITPTDQAKLFQPFVQVDSSLNRQYEGTGLGLVLVKRIVELHGGEVSLCSEPGQGSCFTIRLPYTCELKAPQNEPCPCFSDQAPTVQVLKSERTISPDKFDLSSNSVAPLILLAEDNEASISTVSSYLKARGYQLVVAKNGEEAIGLTQTHQPALILMDIQMPVVDGLEAIQRIRQDAQTEHIPIIALTALAMEGDRERCLEAGANDYLAKPVKLKHLVTTMQQLLGQD